LVGEDDAGRPRRLGAGGVDDIVAADSGVFGLVVVLDEDGVRVRWGGVRGDWTGMCAPGFTNSGD
jgi:hypothetical protein